jgi:dolichol kinase
MAVRRRQTLQENVVLLTQKAIVHDTCMRCTLYFASFGYFEATWRTYLTTIAVSLCAAIVESLPLPIDDNLTVPFIAIAVGMLLLPY